jgi:ribA/ribD-fused uncharacterized protein
MGQTRIYNINEVISFRKTTEAFGGLSNMAAGYSLNVNGILVPTAEHLYQACRFPNHPEIQEAIILEASPMNAKLISRKNIDLTRSDWNDVRVKIMRWCLQIKLSQNWEKFSKLLLETGDKSIVEFTKKDKMWGATQEGNTYVGVNALGRLLMELREDFVKQSIQPYCVEPAPIDNFKLLSSSIEIVCNDVYMTEIQFSQSEELELV